MRLSDVLSKKPIADYVQVDGFVTNKKGTTGQKVDLSVGTVRLNYFCENCGDMRTFNSQGQLACVFINKRLISIDCVLSCGCGATVQVWFLVESENDMTTVSPKVRILHKNEKLSSNVRFNTDKYRQYSILLDKAEYAYRNDLGAGAIVYLRKVFEMVTVQTANALGIEYEKYEGGNPKNFTALLEKVDAKYSIIPTEFAENKKQLFSELSAIVHGDFDEELGLKKFQPLYRLVVGIIENVFNKEEFKRAKEFLNWENGAN